MTEIIHDTIELKRIFATALLACALLLLSVVLDGPVTVLGWMLVVTGFICLIYIAVASGYLWKRLRPQNEKAEHHD